MADPDIGVQIDGLLETAAAAARMARTIDSEAERALTDDAKTVVKEARAALMRREGGGTYRRDPQDIGSVGSRVAIRRGGTAVGAASGFTWALTIFGLRWIGRGRGGEATAEGAVAAGNLIAFVVCLPLALPIPPGRPLDWTIVLYLGLFQIGLAYVLMTRAVRKVSALEVGLLLLLEPVLNALWAWLVHGERPGSWSLAGCTVILLSTVAYVLRRR